MCADVIRLLVNVKQTLFHICRIKINSKNEEYVNKIKTKLHSLGFLLELHHPKLLYERFV